jgi:hypothetical protein
MGNVFCRFLERGIDGMVVVVDKEVGWFWWWGLGDVSSSGDPLPPPRRNSWYL